MDTGTSSYLRRIGRRKLLTKEQEVMLSQIIEMGRPSDGYKPALEAIRDSKKARDRMTECNLRLVVSIAKGYQNRGCELDDLIAAGNMGLMKAVERFDWRRGFRFSTYGSWWIRQACGREVASQGRSIRMPGRAANLAKDLKQARDEFIELHGQEPTKAELADLLGVTETTISVTIEGAPAIISLDDSMGCISGGERKIQDMIADEDADSPLDMIEKSELVVLVGKVLKTLTDREEKILRMRFGIGVDAEDHENFPVTESEIEEMESERSIKRENRG